jgi:hypothetical protein
MLEAWLRENAAWFDREPVAGEPVPYPGTPAPDASSAAVPTTTPSATATATPGAAPAAATTQEPPPA